jgi:hypothetical protein
MIKKLFIATTILFFSFSKGFSQMDIDVKLNTLKLLGHPELGVEVGAGKMGFELDASYLFKNWGADVTTLDASGNEVLLESAVKRSGINATLKMHYYFNPEYSLDRWRVTPYVKYRTQTLMYAEPVLNTKIGAGLMLGRKHFFTDRIGYEFEFGFGSFFVNKFVNKATKQPSEIATESLSGLFASTLGKFDIPVGLTVIYRFGEGFQK